MIEDIKDGFDRGELTTYQLNHVRHWHLALPNLRLRL